MKLFENWKKRVREIKEEFAEEDLKKEVFKKERVQIHNTEERTEYVRSCCEQMLEASREVENSKIEYQLVTDYLTDMQEIENLPLGRKARVVEYAKQITDLLMEKKRHKPTTNKITDIQFWQFSKMEEEIPGALRNLKENEEYQSNVKIDMKRLEGEKLSASFRKKDSIKSQKQMTGLSIVAAVLVGIALISCIMAEAILKMPMQLGYILVMFVTFFLIGGIFLKIHHNLYEIKVSERDLNNAIALLNKVKIRYVNVTGVIEYTYEKYSVNSAYELEYLWEQYLEEKAERQRQQEASLEIDYYNGELIKELRKFGLKDPTVWVHQAAALIDNKEMVEIRHRLITRRQKLRARIENGNNIMKDAKQEISEMVKKYPEYAKDILAQVEKIG